MGLRSKRRVVRVFEHAGKGLIDGQRRRTRPQIIGCGSAWGLYADRRAKSLI